MTARRLSRSQALALAAIAEHGNPHQGCRLVRSDTLAALVERGLVAPNPRYNPKRGNVYRVTAAGRAWLRSREP